MRIGLLPGRFSFAKERAIRYSKRESPTALSADGTIIGSDSSDNLHRKKAAAENKTPHAEADQRKSEFAHTHSIHTTVRTVDRGRVTSRRKAIVGAVIRSKRSKVCNCIVRRSNAHSACATTVVVLTTVKKLNIVVLTQAIAIADLQRYILLL